VSTLEIVQVGDPVLRRLARPVTREELASPEFQRFVGSMRDTMRAAPGVGLAAPQVGASIALAVIEDPVELQKGLSAEQLAARERSPVGFHVLVNPTLHFVGDERVEHYEGCLSFSGFSMVVARARRVHVDALDERGAPVSIDASGWYARILQHEIDHLHGVVCCDRMDPRTLASGPNYLRHCSGKSLDEVRAQFASRGT